MLEIYKTCSRELRILFWARSFLAFGGGLSYPFFVVYLTKQGLPLDTIGLLFSILILISAIGALLGGPLSDSLGSAKTMVFALLWRSATTAILASAILFGFAPPLLMVVYYAHALVGEAFIPASEAFIAERSDTAQRQKIFSFLRVGVNAGWAIGSAAGGLLAASVGYGPLFFLTALVILTVSQILRGTLLHNCVSTFPKTKTVRFELPFAVWAESLKNKQWIIYLGLIFVAFIGVSQLFNLMSVYLVRYREASERTIGVLYSLNGFLVIFTQSWVTRRLQRFLLARAIALGLLFYALGLFALGFSSHFYLYAMSVVVITIGEVVFSPAWLALTTQMAGAFGGGRRRGTYIGMAQFAAVLGGFFASVFGGYLLEHLGVIRPYLPWMIISGITLISAMSFYKLTSSLGFGEEVIATPYSDTGEAIS